MFCAGGDLAHAYDAMRAGDPPLDFFADEYSLNAAFARFPKPCVSLIDGIVMGGGVGISLPRLAPRDDREGAVRHAGRSASASFPTSVQASCLSRPEGQLRHVSGVDRETRIRAGDALRSVSPPTSIRRKRRDGFSRGVPAGSSPNRVLPVFFSRPARRTGRRCVADRAACFRTTGCEDVLTDCGAGNDRRRLRRHGPLRRSTPSRRRASPLRSGRSTPARCWKWTIACAWNFAS